MTTHPTSENMLEKLARLAACRTTRTDRLQAAVHALLSMMERGCEPGTEITVNGLTLAYLNVRSNVGACAYWHFTSGSGDLCVLEYDVGMDRFLHGDFHCRMVGPTRGDLVAFALCAPAFVSALIAHNERTIAVCDTALENVARAAEAVQS
jgi:hypothetical protein